MRLKSHEVPNCFDEVADLFMHKDDGSLQNHVFINMDKLYAYYNWSNTIKEQLQDEMNEYLYEVTGTYQYLNPASPKQMVRALTELLGIPYEQLANKQGKISTSVKTIENLKSEYKSTFTSLYLDYKKEHSVTTNLKPFLAYDDPARSYTNNEGNRIVAIPVYYDPSDTVRFQANNPPMQNITREMTDIISAPKDWVVLQVDSKQIEPTLYHTHVVRDPLIDFLIGEYGDVYYAVADYCMRESISSSPENMYAIGSISKEDRNAFKTLLNASSYGAGKGTITAKAKEIIFDRIERNDPKGKELLRKMPKLKKSLSNPRLPQIIRNRYEKELLMAEAKMAEIKQNVNDLVEGFTERVINHPHRKAFLENEKVQIKQGKRVFESLFGDKRAASGDFNYLLNCSINNPLQISVSRLSAYSVKLARDFIRDNGIEKLAFYSLCKHDEDVYVAHKSVAEIALDYFKDLREYHIDDWHPIYSDSNMGLNYTK